MSFKDLEAEIALWQQREREAADKLATLRAKKAFRTARNQRGPVHVPVRVPKVITTVKLCVRPVKPVPLSLWQGTTREWATQEEVRTYEVDTLSTLEAEVQAIKFAAAQGYMLVRTVSITQA